MLFNIFSLYGNIDKIYINNVNWEAIVYYETEINQLMGLHYLNNVPIFEQEISIVKLKRTRGCKSGRNSFNSKRSRRNSDSSNKQTSFFNSKQKTTNKPNNILYIFNLSQKVTLKIIKELFETVDLIDNLYYLNESQNSALVFFEKLESAVKVLCMFKNMTLIDKNLKINFANDDLVRISKLNRNR